jgi:hypothetical protein
MLHDAAHQLVRGLVGPGLEERHLLYRVNAAQRQLRQLVQTLIVDRAQRQTRGA